MAMLGEWVGSVLSPIGPPSGQAGSAASPVYDPERTLWIPGRRRFLFLSGMTLAGTVLGVKSAPPLLEKIIPIRILSHQELNGLGYVEAFKQLDEALKKFGLSITLIENGGIARAWAEQRALEQAGFARAWA